MPLKDVGGVLSRYFVLGFFTPAFFAVFALSQLLDRDFLPNKYEKLSWTGQTLVVGGAALFIGLLLLGLRYPIVRIFEGYPLERPRLRHVRRPLVWLQGRAYDRLAKGAKWRFDRLFHPNRDRLLPTRLGNAIRASEVYSYTRWGVDPIAIWPRVEPLLTEQEQELHADAGGHLAFFLNGVLGALAVGAVLIADAIAHGARTGSWAYAGPFVLALLLYRAAIGAAERRGTERRASIDLHRLEVYDRLGVRAPRSFSEERKEIGPAVSRCLLYGEAIPDQFTRREATGNQH